MPPTDTCPTCGSAVRVVSSDGGTSHYEPTDPAAALRTALEAAQWGAAQYEDSEAGGNHLGNQCPVCDAWEPGPHTDECIIGRALATSQADGPDETCDRCGRSLESPPCPETPS